MNSSFVISIIILLIIIFIMYRVKVEKFVTQEKIEYYDFGKNKNGSVCFVAGVHGNEPAGSEMLKDLLKTDYFNKCAQKYGLMIRVIPTVNSWGLQNGVRYQPNFLYPDVNRNFFGEGLEPTSQQVIDLTNNMDTVVDFHEGWGFHRMNSNSLGSTISPGDTPLSVKISEMAVNRINQSILDPWKKFVSLQKHSCEIPKTLSCFRECQRKNYLLVETSGQNDIQPIELRKKQVFDIVDEALKIIAPPPRDRTFF